MKCNNCPLDVDNTCYIGICPIHYGVDNYGCNFKNNEVLDILSQDDTCEKIEKLILKSKVRNKYWSKIKLEGEINEST
jgi:hypothetical protein